MNIFMFKTFALLLISSAHTPLFADGSRMRLNEVNAINHFLNQHYNANKDVRIDFTPCLLEAKAQAQCQGALVKVSENQNVLYQSFNQARLMGSQKNTVGLRRGWVRGQPEKSIVIVNRFGSEADWQECSAVQQFLCVESVRENLAVSESWAKQYVKNYNQYQHAQPVARDLKLDQLTPKPCQDCQTQKEHQFEGGWDSHQEHKRIAANPPRVPLRFTPKKQSSVGHRTTEDKEVETQHFGYKESFNKEGNYNVTTDGFYFESSLREWSFYNTPNSSHTTIVQAQPSKPGSSVKNHVTVFYFFPKTQETKIKTQGDKNMVDLGHGETIVFNKKTHRILGGVFQEDTKDIKYTGDRIFMRASQLGDPPSRFTDTVEFHKKGYAPCRVPADAVWKDRFNENREPIFTIKSLDRLAQILNQYRCEFSVNKNFR